MLGQLYEYVKSLKSDFQTKSSYARGEGPPKTPNMPEVINHIMWARQLEARVKELLSSSEALLSDVSSFEKFKKICVTFIDELAVYMKENYENWIKETTENIENDDKPLRFDTFYCRSIHGFTE